MNRIFKRLPLAVAVSMALPVLAQAQETRLGSVVVTAPVTEAPLTVTTDPKAPRQPLPAHDGADMLKSIPGFSVIRKGGTDGDPVFRGMSGSRLDILLGRTGRAWWLWRAHGPADRLHLPGVLRPRHRAEGAADRALRWRQLGRRWCSSSATSSA